MKKTTLTEDQMKQIAKRLPSSAIKHNAFKVVRDLQRAFIRQQQTEIENPESLYWIIVDHLKNENI